MMISPPTAAYIFFGWMTPQEPARPPPPLEIDRVQVEIDRLLAIVHATPAHINAQQYGGASKHLQIPEPNEPSQ